MDNPNIEFDEPLLTIKDIQRILDCGRDKAYEIVHTPGFPKLCFGKRTIRVRAKAFDEWMQDNEGKTII